MLNFELVKIHVIYISIVLTGVSGIIYLCLYNVFDTEMVQKPIMVVHVLDQKAQNL